MNKQVGTPGKILDCKPVVTYAGDSVLFKGLEASLIDGLPRDPSDWRRSYGRPPKSVYVEAMFVPFLEEHLPKEEDGRLIGQPVFHVYWTDCTDLEVYRNSVREGLEAWFKALARHDASDWMVVIVETPDIRKGNKLLPRTTVLDKIRAEFAGKQPDRCLSVIHPIRSESRSAESWRGLLERLRHLLLSGYNRLLLKFGELIRAERERRNEQGWSFCKYFMLQEEQAFVLEMLGLYDEALVQYDELDALFTQFVLNSNVGESPMWLSDFQRPIESWSGIVLTSAVDIDQRARVGEGEASLLQFRAYLFTRQCALLLLMYKPWEIAQRCLPFLHNCLNELLILEVESPAGATACWVALCCLEVLHTCERFNDSGQVEAYSLYTASLWAYARDKLRELGELAGLMPGSQPTSRQLDTVVWLSAGMGDAPTTNNSGASSPIDTLNDALSSQAAFQKHYLELAELAMGTYKHIGRIRSARLIGRDLASFYRCLGQAQKAAAFLGDALATFREEGWGVLEVQTLLELAECFRDLGDRERLAKSCACISSVPSLPMSIRQKHFEEMLASLESLPSESHLLASLHDAFELVSMTLITAPGSSEPMVRGEDVCVSVNVKLLLPGPVQVLPCVALLQLSSSAKATPAHHSGQGFDARLHMVENLDFKQDKALGSASIVCSNPKQFLRRQDSRGKGPRPNVAIRGDFSLCLRTEGEVLLQPGLNTFRVMGKAGEEGSYVLGQLSLTLGGRLEFLSATDQDPPPASSTNGASPPRRRPSRTLPPRALSHRTAPAAIFSVKTWEASVTVQSVAGVELVVRLWQKLEICVTAGSAPILQGTELKLKGDRGLHLGLETASKEQLSRELVLVMPGLDAGESTVITLNSLAQPPNNSPRTNSLVEYKVTMQGLWSDDKSLTLHYSFPMQTSVRLHTAREAKFVQVSVSALCTGKMSLSKPHLEFLNSGVNSGVELLPLDPGETAMTLGPISPVSYMWSLKVDPSSDLQPLRARFNVTFCPLAWKDQVVISGPYSSEFDLADYRTLYVVSSSVEPAKGSEFCRANSLCHLQLTIERLASPGNSQGSDGEQGALMYELLADQSTWAVCGRTAGVVTLASESRQSVTLDVMPITGGFLPHPLVRLSKYIPAELKSNKDAGSSHSRLKPFSAGQVYNASKGQQVHVLVSANQQESSLP